jgi:hypothetical protein
LQYENNAEENTTEAVEDEDRESLSIGADRCRIVA